MVSVTMRVNNFSQPFGGFVPADLFEIRGYVDHNDIMDIPSAAKSVQGLAVDYMSRFMLTKDKEAAFDISIKGAKIIDKTYENNNETRIIESMLKNVKGLDDVSIFNACRIVCYDVAMRMGVSYFRPIEEFLPSKELINNIRIMVNRCLTFFSKVGGVILSGFTFEGGYTKLVSSGDGDYLTKDTLIDLKVTNKSLSTKWSLQVLVYYLLGLHSIHREFDRIEKLCIFNPLKNMSYTVKLSEIDNKSKYYVSNQVIGYKMKEKKPDYSNWREIDGEDVSVFSRFIRDNSVRTSFDVNVYKDGIYDITTDDYWSYAKKINNNNNKLRPVFKTTKSVKFIKHNGFIMFVSESYKGVLNILSGGSLKKCTHSLEYYYDNIEKYAKTVLALFSEYWKVLFEISKQISSLSPSEEYLRKNAYSKYLESYEKMLKRLNSGTRKPLGFDEWYKLFGHRSSPEGTVHGSIVDIDETNHIYLNPYDGKIVPYSAVSMYDKNVYRNVVSLISKERPELLSSFQSRKNDKDDSLSLVPNTVSNMIFNPNDDISTETIKVYEKDMYDVSKKLLMLQSIYTDKLVKAWFDDILEKHSDGITIDRLLEVIDVYEQE
ncbi:MAG: hypothetical protein IKH78_08345 [Ruminococcus sp.]|nr:hypothetical protein [Ruminococcus sp.]MBR6968528.1 hypothetical protein [Ruminococcus sp.]